ncbi:amiloride-sensitive sodium channel subunit beta-like [Mercenaria mercenaria]|uniref:amiloride-sensitive sodium channel subunit beta-like n=1 Tax=Mercenaria mercenaria TaxID=6596 RepID=UPI00234EEB32|nr:amiloride-sensitive sodium channel subunit beta-like [Mercenaria mercenaria]
MDADNKKRSFPEVLRELMESSTVHGIPKIASSRQVAVKVMWCILMIAGFCVLTFQLVALFRTFQSHPVQTTVSLDFSTLRFPAISFCNMNPVRKSKIGMSQQLRDTVFPKKQKYTLAPTETPTETDETKARKKRQLDLPDASASAVSVDVSLLETNDTENIPYSGDYEMIDEESDIYNANKTVRDVSNTTVSGLLKETVSGAANETFTDEAGEAVTVALDETFTDETGETVTVDSNETSTESSYESSTYSSFYYNYDEHYTWDLFDYHGKEEGSFNLTASNITYEYVDITLSEHYQDPKDKWELVITKFKTAYRNVSVAKRKRMGHQREDFIQYASFATREQNVS